jgi:hypothetical protein
VSGPAWVVSRPIASEHNDELSLVVAVQTCDFAGYPVLLHVSLGSGDRAILTLSPKETQELIDALQARLGVAR